MPRRGRYTEVRKREILTQWERSQLSPGEFIRRNGGPSPKTMMAWIRERRSQSFLPVKVVEKMPDTAAGRVRLSFGSVKLDFNGAIEPDWLVELLKGLQ